MKRQNTKRGQYDATGTMRWGGRNWLSLEAFDNQTGVIQRTNKKHVYLDGQYLGLEHNLGIPAGRYKSGDTVVHQPFVFDRKGYVYVIVNPAWPTLCKIGRSHDPEGRLKTANTWCPYSKFELHEKVYDDDCYALERAVHSALADRNRELVGEWFEINRWHAANLIRKVQRECKRSSSTSRPTASTIPSQLSTRSVSSIPMEDVSEVSTTSQDKTGQSPTPAPFCKTLSVS